MLRERRLACLNAFAAETTFGERAFCGLGARRAQQLVGRAIQLSYSIAVGDTRLTGCL
jgi:hypothetical protein